MISGLGSGISSIATPLLVLAATGSAAKAAIVGACSSLTYALCCLPAGVLADRYQRKAILISTPLIELAAVAAVTVSLLAGHFWLPLLAGAAIVQAAMAALRSAAGRPAFRRIVPAQQLDLAVSRTLTGSNAVELVAPVLGGGLFGVARWLPFAVDSLSFAATAIAAMLLRTPLGPESRSRQRFGTELAAGLKYVWGNAYLRFVAGWSAVIGAGLTVLPLVEVVLLRWRGAQPWLIGVASGIGAAGGLLGAAASKWMIGRIARRRLVLLGSWAIVCTVAVAAVLPHPLLIAGVMGVAWFLFSPLVVVINAYELRVIPDELQARAQTIMSMSELALPWATFLAVGAIADRAGPVVAVLAVAGVLGVAALIASLAKSLHELDR